MLGGVVLARTVRFAEVRVDGGGGVCTLLRSDDGAVCRLRVYGCPPEDEGMLTVGRRVCVLHVWLARGSDGWPLLRVHEWR